MNRHLRTFFALVCALLLISSFAMAETYQVEGVGSIVFPDDYLIITQDTPADSEILSMLGLSHDQAMSLLKAGGIQINAIKSDISHEIVVTLGANSLASMDALSDEMLLGIDWNGIYQQQGITVSNVDIYHAADGTKWVRIWQEKDGMVGLQYYTIYQSQSFNVTVTCYTGTVGADVESTLKQIVDSVVFN